MNNAFKKPTSFSVSVDEDILISKIMDKGVSKVEILRRGIAEYCKELDISIDK